MLETSSKMPAGDSEAYGDILIPLYEAELQPMIFQEIQKENGLCYSVPITVIELFSS
jgi:hypothetical protein